MKGYFSTSFNPQYLNIETKEISSEQVQCVVLLGK